MEWFRRKSAAEQEVIERVRPAAVHEEIQHLDRPHQRVFEAELVPEIAADAPALDIGHCEEDQNRHRDDAREQAEREQRPAYQLHDRDRRRPELSGPIAVAVELRRQLADRVRVHAGIGKEAERVAQAMWHQRQADGRPQQRFGDRRQCFESHLPITPTLCPLMPGRPDIPCKQLGCYPGRAATAARPGTQVPRHLRKGSTGVLGSRLSLRSAGMTTEETAPYAIGLMLMGNGSVPEYATARMLQPDLAEVDAGAELSRDCFATAA